MSKPIVLSEKEIRLNSLHFQNDLLHASVSSFSRKVKKENDILYRPKDFGRCFHIAFISMLRENIVNTDDMILLHNELHNGMYGKHNSNWDGNPGWIMKCSNEVEIDISPFVSMENKEMQKFLHVLHNLGVYDLHRFFDYATAIKLMDEHLEKMLEKARSEEEEADNTKETKLFSDDESEDDILILDATDMTYSNRTKKRKYSASGRYENESDDDSSCCVGYASR